MNIILIPLYKISSLSDDTFKKYKKLVDLNCDNIQRLKINANVKVVTKTVENLRDMWIDILNLIIKLTIDGHNVLYMEGDTVLFQNCNDIFEIFLTKFTFYINVLFFI